MQRPAISRFARASGFAIAASFALALPAEAAGYLKLGDIKGEGKDFYKGWIELNTVTCAGGATAATPSVSEIVVTKKADRATPKLAEAAAKGKVFPSAQIHVLNASGASASMRWQIKEVFISSYQTSAAQVDDGSIPTETLSLNFDKITWRAQDGSKGTGCPR